MSESHALLRAAHDGDRTRLPLPGRTPVPAPGTSIARMRHGAPIDRMRLDARRVVHADMPDERALDLFRELRTRLLFASPVANPVILVTGVRTNCGASFVARNLAAAIALDEDRTALLIDCNLRRPSADRVFDVDGPGLIDYLRTPTLGVETILHPAGVPRLRVIPAGGQTRNGGDRLASLRMRSLVDELHGRYPDRCVVLDAPPARGAPEARVLAERADLVVLVAGEAMHTRDDIAQAAQVFDPTRFAGVVFNQLP